MKNKNLEYYIKGFLHKTGIAYLYYKRVKTPSKFIFEGKDLPYFYHKYNKTYFNERKIEISLH